MNIKTILENKDTGNLHKIIKNNIIFNIDNQKSVDFLIKALQSMLVSGVNKERDTAFLVENIINLIDNNPSVTLEKKYNFFNNIYYGISNLKYFNMFDLTEDHNNKLIDSFLSIIKKDNKAFWGQDELIKNNGIIIKNYYVVENNGDYRNNISTLEDILLGVVRLLNYYNKEKENLLASSEKNKILLTEKIDKFFDNDLQKDMREKVIKNLLIVSRNEKKMFFNMVCNVNIDELVEDLLIFNKKNDGKNNIDGFSKYRVYLDLNDERFEQLKNVNGFKNMKVLDKFKLLSDYISKYNSFEGAYVINYDNKESYDTKDEKIPTLFCTLKNDKLEEVKKFIKEFTTDILKEEILNLSIVDDRYMKEKFQKIRAKDLNESLRSIEKNDAPVKKKKI